MIACKTSRDVPMIIKKMIDVDDQQAKAIAVLFGGYNRHGRKMDVDKYHEVAARFEAIIDEVAEQI